MLTKEHPKQRDPRYHRGEKALHGPITAPLTSPPGQAQHRDTPCHDQQGTSNPVELAQGCHRHMGLEALEKCYNVHEGFSVG